MLREDAVAPVAHAAHGLHAARPVRRALVRHRVLLLLGVHVAEAAVEALPEAPPHRVPVLAQRVPRDGLLGRDLDVGREREPVVVSAGVLVWGGTAEGTAYSSCLYCAGVRD